MNILHFHAKKSKHIKALILSVMISLLMPQMYITVAFADGTTDTEEGEDTSDKPETDEEDEDNADMEETDEDDTGEETSVSESAAMYIPATTLGDITAPLITAEGAILMDADNGVILYQKNMDEPYFPASITKIMTCLLAVENCSLSETVTMSNEAVFGIDRTSSNVGLDVGQSLPMEEAILCVMLASANEAASAIAEHVSGSIDEFVKLMNQRAEELGCTHTHFANANGLPNDNHYISPHDMALIAKAFNDNDTCRRLASMRTYDVAVTATQPDEIHLLNHHKMYPGLSYAYDPVVWGKTGYTIAAGATLVTVAESDGLSLICVVMKDESEKNYTDTRTLFDFGFGNYTRLNVAENDDTYNMTEALFFQTDDTTFGSTRSFITLDTKGYVVVPEGTPFSKLDSEIVYKEKPEDGVLAEIIYTLGGSYAGECDMLLIDTGEEDIHFGSVLTGTSADRKVTFINVKEIIPYIALAIAVIAFIVFMVFVIRAYNFGNAVTRRMDIKKRRKRYHSDFDDIDF